ncbi:hypothetical protein CI610_02341 [invertebrate metagenome]|uniref:Protein kinase domain-containing protein n=1 Tax=invertebrate metagenome TaxID=1711999 RepID=A0A2H9T653_9ZZZZ
MNEMAIRMALVSELQNYVDTAKAEINVEYSWKGRNVKTQISDTGNRILNNFLAGKADSHDAVGLHNTLESILQRSITQQDRMRPDEMVKEILDNLQVESEQSGGQGDDSSSIYADDSWGIAPDTRSDASDSVLSDRPVFSAKDIRSFESLMPQEVSNGEIHEKVQYLESLVPGIDEVKKNRRDKKDTGAAFTQVLMKNSGNEGKDQWAALLNTVPDEVLDGLDWAGWDKSKTHTLPVREKGTKMSPNSSGMLGTNVSLVQEPKEGRYLGEGSFGKVKFALVTDEEGNSKLCVAKKMKMFAPNDAVLSDQLKDLKHEIVMQQQAGEDVSPVIYGHSHTVNKNGKDLLIVFMEPAVGISGSHFFSQKQTGLAPEENIQVLLNVTDTVMNMHQSGVFHNDLKWGNCSFDSSTLKTQVLDYGLSTTNKVRLDVDEQFSFESVPCYFPLEVTRKRTKDSEKVDVYQLGHMYIDVLRTNRDVPNPFHSASYYSDDLLENWLSGTPIHRVKKDTSEKMALIDFPSPEARDLIRDMLSVKPEDRPTMEEVRKRLVALPRV